MYVKLRENLMSRKFRKVKAKTRRRVRKHKAPYKSGLEQALHEGPLKSWEYEPNQVDYVWRRKYTPDFVLGNLWIEAKGFFRGDDRQKYIAIQDSHPEIELIFVFSNPHKAVRKGTKLTMAQWAEKQGFRWYDLNNAHQIEELITNDDD